MYIEVAKWLAVAAVSAACSREAQPLRVGATFTLEQSGALALLDSLPPPHPVALVVSASGQILRAAAAGDLDAVIAHAPPLERRLLIRPGRAALRCPFVVSRFAIVGPADDPARVAAARTATDALRRVAAARGPFISRGDSSGTHIKELGIWTAIGAVPADQPWYVESGADQATTLRIAAERDAYAIADLPTWARIAPPGLRLVFAGDTALTNPYTLYLVRDDAAPRAFVRWALDTWRDRLLNLRLSDGTPAFETVPGDCA